MRKETIVPLCSLFFYFFFSECQNVPEEIAQHYCCNQFLHASQYLTF